MAHEEDFTIGVEEEYQIIDPETRSLTSRVQQILPFAKKTIGEKVHPEVQLSQIEIDTPVCQLLLMCVGNWCGCGRE